MDTSETYIKMADCPEIQEQWQYDGGDFYVHRFWKEDGEQFAGKEIVLNLCESCNVIDSCGGTKVGEYSPKGKYIWLPRQDQLQEIYGENDVFKDYPTDRVGRLWNIYKEKGGANRHWIGLTSMEQLWLAFVMKEKFNKVRNGDKWEQLNA